MTVVWDRGVLYEVERGCVGVLVCEKGRQATVGGVKTNLILIILSHYFGFHLTFVCKSLITYDISSLPRNNQNVLTALSS